jgi:uncharacterized membrane protein
MAVFWILFWWLAFAGSHLVLSSVPVRRPLIARVGARGFQGLYSLIALATFVPLVRTYWAHRHTGPQLWNLWDIAGMREVSIVLSGIACVFLILAFFQPSPTGLAPGAATRARGVNRITRHPLFAAIGLWGFAHLLVNGYLSDVVFFGGFLVFALVGAAHQDARKRVTEAETLTAFFTETSLLPFGAIIAGRNRLMVDEIPWLAVAVGVAVAAVLYVAHGRLFAA